MLCSIAIDLVGSKPMAGLNDTLSGQPPFEAYDVENTSSGENVTLEFFDLPTTEDFSSTTSISQYLETASYRDGMHLCFSSHFLPLLCRQFDSACKRQPGKRGPACLGFNCIVVAGLSEHEQTVYACRSITLDLYVKLPTDRPTNGDTAISAPNKRQRKCVHEGGVLLWIVAM